MNSLLITAPILAGKLDTWNRFISTLLKDRRQDYETAIVEGGVKRLRVWHQRGPEGTDHQNCVMNFQASGAFQLMFCPGSFGSQPWGPLKTQ